MENLVNPAILSSFYNKKKIFITGHTGFKGSWLMAVLSSFGAKIKGYALEPQYTGGIYDYLSVMKLGESVLNDIRNKAILEEEILKFSPDIIFHLAAQPLVRRSYEIPAETFEVNVTGTANVLECVMKLQKRCSVIVVTTDKVYQNKEKNVLYIEEDALGGHDPYSSSKACTELVVEAFRKSFFCPEANILHQKAIASARAGNVIGGGDWSKDRLFPDIIQYLQNNRPVLVRNPSAIRPWQHVLEALAGYLLLALKMHENPTIYARAYNFGPLPADHLSVRELVAIAIDDWGGGSWKDLSNITDPHEAGILKLDITRAIRELNWKPKLNARQAISATIDWYKVEEKNKAEFTFKQIEEYFLL